MSGKVMKSIAKVNSESEMIADEKTHLVRLVKAEKSYDNDINRQ